MGGMVSGQLELKKLFQRIRHQPKYLQIKIIKIYLLSQLRFLSQEEITYLCSQILMLPNINHVNQIERTINQFVNGADNIKNRIISKLSVLHKELFAQDSQPLNVYQAINDLDEKLIQVKGDLLSLARNVDKGVVSLDEAVELIAAQQQKQLQAMNQAIDEILKRIIDSLAPSAAEHFVDHSIIRVGPLKKAAQLDAIQEKYEQVNEYYKKGKLSRDFRVLYKSHLKKLKDD